jgi:hypothetical protein
MKDQNQNIQPKIKGGYYLKARKIQSSWIAKAPPFVREIWDWLLMNANHTDNEICKRGQQIRTYKDILDGLAWYIGWRKQTYTKWQCEKAMKLLREHNMIATTKTTRGILIEIVNYDYYQNPENYESHKRATTKATREPQTSHTINKNDNNDKNDNNNIYKEKVNKEKKYFELPEYLINKEQLKQDFINGHFKKYNVTLTDVIRKAEQLYNWYLSNPKKNKKSNWRATLINAIIRDFGYQFNS